MRWCPGCGDYSILTAVQMLMPELGVRPREHGVRVRHRLRGPLPVLHEHLRHALIHGRAPAIATGLAMARPDLDVWVVAGDGDMLSIGGNHLIHALRRNVNLTILLFNNQIYGLTKGQYSPTSEVGQGHQVARRSARSTSPFNPVSVALGAEATFVARTHDMDRKHMMEMFRRAHDHNGRRVRRDLPELQRLQRRRLRGRSPARTTATGHADPAGARRADPLRRRRRARACVMGTDGQLRIVDVADVGADAILVHDETRRPGPGLHAVPPGRRARTSPRRSACSAPSTGPTTAGRRQPPARGVQEQKGPGDLARPAALRTPPGQVDLTAAT